MLRDRHKSARSNRHRFNRVVIKTLDRSRFRGCSDGNSYVQFSTCASRRWLDKSCFIISSQRSGGESRQNFFCQMKSGFSFRWRGCRRAGNFVERIFLVLFATGSRLIKADSDRNFPTYLETLFAYVINLNLSRLGRFKFF